MMISPPPTIIKQHKRFSHRMSVQNSQNWEEKSYFCTTKCKLLSQCFFFEVWMQDLYTKALVGMAQNNISQDCKLASQRNSTLQTQTLYQGFVLRSFLRLFQSMPLSWKKLYWLTPQRQPDPVLSITLWGFLQSVCQKTWENFQLLETFFSQSDNFPKPTSVSHVGLVSTLSSSLLTNWDSGSVMGNMSCSPQPALLGLTPNCASDTIQRALGTNCSLSS